MQANTAGLQADNPKETNRAGLKTDCLNQDNATFFQLHIRDVRAYSTFRPSLKFVATDGRSKRQYKRWNCKLTFKEFMHHWVSSVDPAESSGVRLAIKISKRSRMLWLCQLWLVQRKSVAHRCFALNFRPLSSIAKSPMRGDWKTFTLLVKGSGGRIRLTMFARRSGYYQRSVLADYGSLDIKHKWTLLLYPTVQFLSNLKPQISIRAFGQFFASDKSLIVWFLLQLEFLDKMAVVIREHFCFCKFADFKNNVQ